MNINSLEEIRSHINSINKIIYDIPDSISDVIYDTKNIKIIEEKSGLRDISEKDNRKDY